MKNIRCLLIYACFFPVLLSAQTVGLRAQWNTGDRFSYRNNWRFDMPELTGEEGPPSVDFFQTFTVRAKTDTSYTLLLHTDSINILNGKEDKDASVYLMFYKLDYEFETDRDGRFKKVLHTAQLENELLREMRELWSDNTAAEALENIRQQSPDWPEAFLLRDYGFAFAQYGLVQKPGKTVKTPLNPANIYFGPSYIPFPAGNADTKAERQCILTQNPDKSLSYAVKSSISDIARSDTMPDEKAVRHTDSWTIDINSDIRYDAGSGRILEGRQTIDFKGGATSFSTPDGKVFDAPASEFHEQRSLTAVQPRTVPTVPAGISYPAFPSFEAVVRAFFEKNKTRYEQPYFSLQKKPDGYWVQRTQENGEPVGKPQLFWSVKTGNYLTLSNFSSPLPPDPNEAPSIAEAYNDNDVQANSDRYLFRVRDARAESDRQPYFGYSGWYNDVIQFLEPEIALLNNQQLHALARAYSFAASGLLHNNSGFADSTRMFALKPGRPALSADQVGEYQAANRKAVEAYALLWKRDPEFQTPVGNIRTKYANEIMDGFLTLLYFQDEKTARQQLRPGVYDQFLLQSARNLLKSCPTDAVLFTHGDSDTYPLLYVQATEQLRTDVLVANTGLLVLPRYYSCLTDGVMGSKPLKSALPALFFREMVIITANEQNTDRSAGEFFKEIEQAETTDSGLGYRLLPLATGSVECTEGRGAGVKWEFSGNYLALDQLAQLDIAYANGFSRPLCYALTGGGLGKTNWQAQSTLEGLVYRLLPDTKLDPGPDQVLDTEAALRLWLKSFSIAVQEPIRGSDQERFYNVHIYAGFKLATALIEERKTKAVVELLDLLNTGFSNEIRPRGFYWTDLARFYAECGQPEIGEKIGLQMVENYTLKRLTTWEMEQKGEVFLSLELMANKYNLLTLKKRLQKK